MELELPSLEAVDRELARREFKHFVRQAWPIVEPGTKILWNWHIDVICDHLQASFEGKTKRLIINCPFRIGKSILVSILYPAWIMIRDPQHHILATSHTHKLVLMHAQKSRALQATDWYKKFFPGNKFYFIKETESQQINNHGGVRYNYGIESKITGITANTLIVDDPMTTASSSSDLEREAVMTNFHLDFMTRLTPPAEGKCVIVMQRLHGEDVSGQLLKNPSWDRLIIPAIYEGENRSRTCLNWVDPRTEVGESFFPSYFSAELLESLRLEKGNQFYASQLQQHPVASEGAIIRYEWIKMYEELPHVLKYTLSCDTAIKAGQDNDFSVLQLWAECENGYYLVDMFRKKLEYTALKDVIHAFTDGNPISELLIEDRASGQQLTQDFKSFTKLPIIPMISGKMMPLRKEERLQLVAGTFESGKVYIPKDAKWRMDFMTEICEFGYTKHDDIVDACTQYLCRVKFNKKRTRITIVEQVDARQNQEYVLRSSQSSY